jgi:Phosphodiester glycosidase
LKQTARQLILLMLVFFLLPVSALAQEPSESFPSLTAEGFLPDGEPEFVFVDADTGIWRYASQTLRIEITRYTQAKPKLRYLAAEIFVKPGTDSFRMVPVDAQNMDKVMDKYKEKPAVIAKNNRLVFSMDGDYFLYRVSRSARVKSYSIGMVIRQGQLLFDNPPSPQRDVYPPLDMLALFPDGDMRVFTANEVSAQELLDSGARDVLSFGPALIRNGVLKTDYLQWGTTMQPRAAIGMVEKGHYWALIVEGRIRESLGTNALGTGEIMQALGCTTAFNLDGGWSSAMVFMGKQLNQLDNSGVRDNAREQNEVMGIGQTDAY